jgi:hypothetical protein
MKNLIISGVESPFLLFSLLLPVSVVAQIYEVNPLDAMMRCKSKFDMAILDGRELNG